MAYQQLRLNNFSHAWKELYTKINAQCNSLGVPYKHRAKLLTKELEFLSLLLHDVLPYNFSEQGIFPGDKNVSSYSLFFSEDDPLSVACKKWLDFLGDDYELFWNVFSEKISYNHLDNTEILKLHDIFEVIWFINPQGIQKLLSSLDGMRTYQQIHDKVSSIEYWTHSRSKIFYVWMMFGWRLLPNDFPAYNSSSGPEKLELSQWIPRSFTREKFISKELYLFERVLNSSETKWELREKYLDNFQDKQNNVTILGFPEIFTYYNGVKFQKKVENYTMYFSNHYIKDRRKIFLDQVHTVHRQLFNYHKNLVKNSRSSN